MFVCFKSNNEQNPRPQLSCCALFCYVFQFQALPVAVACSAQHILELWAGLGLYEAVVDRLKVRVAAHQKQGPGP